jgi:23S rRNA (adenine2503-C2)-methyltransferase
MMGCGILKSDEATTIVPGDEELFLIVDAPARVPDFAPAATVTEESPALTHQPRALFGLSREELTALVGQWGQPAYRARQLEEAMYRQWVSDFDQVTTLPKALRERLRLEGCEAGMPRIVETFRSVDGTERYLIAGRDGQTVETVWMPGGDGGEQGEADGSAVLEIDGSADLEEDQEEAELDQAGVLPRPRPRAPIVQRRATICVSSQIGCAVNCHFCLTAKLGIIRNLTAGEIAGQVVAVLKRQRVHLGRDRINLVFMGMGEPFLNYDAFIAAMHLLIDSVGLAASRMTVSTSGIVPGILRFAQEPVRCKLAISLNASNDVVREQIMPITRKWDIEAVLDAVRTIPLGPRERITFEYVLLGGVNDRIEHADEVVRLVRRAGFACYVNLIVWNPGPGTPYAQPDQAAVDAFQHRLISQGVTAYIRRPRGRDIYAACGQLKRTMS